MGGTSGSGGTAGGGRSGTGGGQGSGGGGAAGGDPDAGPLDPGRGFTPCRDLSPNGSGLAVAAGSDHFLLMNGLGAAVISDGDWRIRRSFTGQLDGIGSGTLSYDGRLGATLGGESVVRIWQTSDGKQIAGVKTGAAPDYLTAPGLVRFSPAELAVAFIAYDGELAVADAETGVRRWTEELALMHPTSLFFTPDGQSLLIGTPAGFERRRVSNGERLGSLSLSGAGGPAALSSDGAALAFTSPDGTMVQVVNPADGLPRSQGIVPDAQVTALAFGRRTDEIVVGTRRGTYLHNVAGGTVLRSFPIAFAFDLAVLPRSGALAIASDQVALFDLEKGDLLYAFGRYAGLLEGAVTPDGHVVMPGFEGPLEVWDPAQGKKILEIERLSATEPYHSPAVTPTGLLFLRFGAELTFWNLSSAALVRRTPLEMADRLFVGELILSRDGKLAIGRGSEGALGKIRVWDAETGQLLRTLPGHGAATNYLALSPSGAVLASVGVDVAPDDVSDGAGHSIKLWDFTSGTLLATVSGHERVINQVAFSPSGNLLISGDRAGWVQLWSVPDGRNVRDLATGYRRVSQTTSNGYGDSVAFSPDGRFVAALGVDWTITNGHTGDIAIWSLDDGRLVAHLLSLSEANLRRLLWSPDGRFIAAPSGEGLRVWCLDELPALRAP
jgi:WD40 repeat protein